MASRFCTKCGLEIVEGKRFCGGCGQPVAERPAVVEAEMAPQPAFAPEQPAPFPAAYEAPPTAPEPLPVPQTQLPHEPWANAGAQAVTQMYPAEQPYASPQGQPPMPAPQPVSDWQTTGHMYQAPAAQTPPQQPGQSSRLIIGVVCAALLFAAAAGGAYAWRKHSSVLAPADAAMNTPSAAELAMSAPPESASKPAAGTAAPQPAPIPAPVRNEAQPSASLPDTHSVTAPAHVDAKPPKPHSAESVSIPAPAPVPAPAPPAPAPIVRQVPESAKAGVLHYSGPPIHKGEAVNFPGLPGSMLRFSFDHAIWQPRISHQPNGTQTLTLHSLSPMEQTQCEVRWEVAQ
jgi:hypothetical protein